MKQKERKQEEMQMAPSSLAGFASARLNFYLFAANFNSEPQKEVLNK